MRIRATALLVPLALLLPGASSAPAVAVPVRWPSLRAAAVNAVERDAADAYSLRPSSRGVSGDSPRQGFRLAVEADSVQLATEAHGALSMRWSAVARGDAVLTVPDAIVAVPVGNHVVAAHGDGLSASYVNGPLGVEQTFHLAKRPLAQGQGSGDLVLSLSLGDAVHAVAAGEAIALVDDNGTTRARYSDLTVLDARGRTIPAHLEAKGRSIAIDIDDQNAVYPLVVDPLLATQTATLTATEAIAGDNVGMAVALDGDTAVVAALTGSVAYVFVRSGCGWTEQAKLAPDGGGTDQDYGIHVAVQGDTALVASPHPFTPSGEGVVYAYLRTGSTWASQGSLSDANAALGSQTALGGVALDGDTAIVAVGSYKASDATADVFERANGTWSLTGQLPLSSAPPDASGGVGSVAIRGDMAAVGRPLGLATGTAPIPIVDVSTRANGTWTLSQTLPAASTDVAGFGQSVALTADTLLVGAPTAEGKNGAAYVYGLQGGQFVSQGELQAPDGAMGDQFGMSVALDGDLALIGAPSVTKSGASGVGAAYLFSRTASAWSWQATLRDQGEDKFKPGFGSGVALQGTIAVVGAPGSALDSIGDAEVFTIGMGAGGGCSSAGAGGAAGSGGSTAGNGGAGESGGGGASTSGNAGVAGTVGSAGQKASGGSSTTGGAAGTSTTGTAGGGTSSSSAGTGGALAGAGGTATDTAAATPASDDSSGCGCRTTGSNGGNGLLVLASTLALFGLRRRRIAS